MVEEGVVIETISSEETEGTIITPGEEGMTKEETEGEIGETEVIEETDTTAITIMIDMNEEAIVY